VVVLCRCSFFAFNQISAWFETYSSILPLMMRNNYATNADALYNIIHKR
jgi:hypothetical protein